VIDQLSDAAVELIGSSAVATVVTLDDDGSPHMSAAWVTRIRVERISGVGPWRRD
jgi:predicted pyridoxine 5'-phosphate oxidase superfamily flavin-nucleotide-binding protein